MITEKRWFCLGRMSSSERDLWGQAGLYQSSWIGKILLPLEQEQDTMDKSSHERRKL